MVIYIILAILAISQILSGIFIFTLFAELKALKFKIRIFDGVTILLAIVELVKLFRKKSD